jgi:hypothetical protein
MYYILNASVRLYGKLYINRQYIESLLLRLKITFKMLGTCHLRTQCHYVKSRMYNIWHWSYTFFFYKPSKSWRWFLCYIINNNKITYPLIQGQETTWYSVNKQETTDIHHLVNGTKSLFQNELISYLFKYKLNRTFPYSDCTLITHKPTINSRLFQAKLAINVGIIYIACNLVKYSFSHLLSCST